VFLELLNDRPTEIGLLMKDDRLLAEDLPQIPGNLDFVALSLP
jgi:hypothetical protein